MFQVQNSRYNVQRSRFWQLSYRLTFHVSHLTIYMFRRFYILVWIRVAAILATCFGLALVIVTGADSLVIVNVSVLLLLQGYLLARYINRINYDLTTLFMSIRSNDYNLNIVQTKDRKEFYPLFQQFKLVSKDIQRFRTEIQRQNEYFKLLVEHINVGVISFNEDTGRVSLLNRAAKELINRNSLSLVQQLDLVQEGLSKLVMGIKPAEQKMVSLYSSSGVVHLSVRASVMRSGDELIKLVSLQNIKAELDENELESWQKLIRVLTHEVMNSVGPISSTISTLMEFMVMSNGESVSPSKVTPEFIDDVVSGLRIVEERSKGMVQFVSQFRSLTLLPQPAMATFDLNVLLKGIERLMQNGLEAKAIAFECCYNAASVSVMADRAMLEQILINLIANSVNALEGRTNKQIRVVSQTLRESKVSISISDNGCGIPLEIQDKIFIPFFTTSKTGSGIGLSLSRQMLKLMGGTISFKSVEGEGTTFTVIL